jgi:glutamine synthetase
MIARPDPTTFVILPWRPKEKAVARMFCDIYEPDGSPYKGDPRYILKVNLEKAKQKGFILYVGPELEYFYFKNDKNTETLDEGGYFDYPTDAAEDLSGGYDTSPDPWDTGRVFSSRGRDSQH